MQVEKWILIISLDGNAIPTTQYFIGSFDGKTFTNENSKETVLWLDYGPDSYAGITYDLLPDGRRIFISWMSRWQYSRSLNFNVWNGQMGFSRELKLNNIGNRILLSSLPIREVKHLRSEQVSKQIVPITNNLVYQITKSGGKRMKHLVDVEMRLDLTHLKSDDTFDIIFSGGNDNLTISLKGNVFTLDRSKAGKADFPNFGRLWTAPRFIDNSDLKLRIIIDRSSIEFYADDGLTVITALFYSEEDIAAKMIVQVHQSVADSKIHLNELNVYQMKSIWSKSSAMSQSPYFIIFLQFLLSILWVNGIISA